jgi:rRNA-processing protein FCF1
MVERTRKPVILDTNFVLLGFENPLFPIEQIRENHGDPEILVLDEVKKELAEQIGSKETVERLLNTKNIETLKTEGEGSVDSLLVRLSDDYKIATNDKEIKDKVKEMDNHVLTVRSRSKVVEE